MTRLPADDHVPQCPKNSVDPLRSNEWISKLPPELESCWLVPLCLTTSEPIAEHLAHLPNGRFVKVWWDIGKGLYRLCPISEEDARRLAEPVREYRGLDDWLDVFEPTSKPTSKKRSEPIIDAAHSDDFRSICWFGTEYTFTGPQAACVKLLWEHWERGTPEVSKSELLDATESSGERVSDVFKRSPAWGKIIVGGEKKGNYRLREPEK